MIRLTQKESFGEIFIQRDEGFDQLLAGERDASRIEEEYKS